MESNIFSMLNQATEKLKQMPPESVELVKKTVAKGADDNELALFMYMCYRYGLDPLLREIYFAKIPKRKGGKPEPTYIVSRDGYLKIAMSHHDFQGLTSFVVKEGDTFEIDANKPSVTHKFGAKRGEIIGAWAVAYRKGYKPQVAFVDFKEYFKAENRAWKQYPSAMIQKVAEVFVLRRQFNITGVVAQEELDVQLDAVKSHEVAREVILDGGMGVEPEEEIDLDTIPEDKIHLRINQQNIFLVNKIKEKLKDEGLEINGGNILSKGKEMLLSGEITDEQYEILKKYAWVET